MTSFLKQIYWKTKHSAEKLLLRKFWCNYSHIFLKYRPFQIYSARIHRWICDTQQREPESKYTCFLRNRPQLEVLSRIVKDWPRSQPIRMVVLACGSGAELFSALWVIKTVRPDLDIVSVGVDISETLINIARNGVYEVGSKVLEGLSDEEMGAMFQMDGNIVRIRTDIASNSSWQVDNLFNPDLVQTLGLQDFVFLNNFLVNFTDEEAVNSFQNVKELVAPNGYLFVAGMDLDIREKETELSGFKPVTFNIEEVHNADRIARCVYPWKFWGVEPFDKSRPNWVRRYSTVFQRSA